MKGPRGWRVAWSAATLTLAGCAGTGSPGTTPAATPSYIQQYADAGSALDKATETWDSLGQALVAANTNTVANEAPINAAYASALQAFGNAVLAIQFPPSAESDVHHLADAAGAVRSDLGGVASGVVPTSQFVADEGRLQDAINVVQHELGLGSSTPIAGG